MGGGGNLIKFEFSLIVTSGKTCEKTKSKFNKTARETFLNLSGFPKHSLFFPSTKTDEALGI